MALGQELASPCMLISARPYQPWYNIFLSQQTGSDVHAPYIKQTAGHIHLSHPPTNYPSLISHVSLSLFKTSTLSTWFGHGSCIFQWYWYVVFSNILSIFIWSIFIFMFLCILHLYIFLFIAFDLYLIMLPHFTWKNFFHIFYAHIFLHFIDKVVWTTDLPHHKN